MGKMNALTEAEVKELLAVHLFQEWDDVRRIIKERFDFAEEWYSAGKAGCELKFRKSGKTIVSLFPGKESIGLMVIFGKVEREKFDAIRSGYPETVTSDYENAKTYHDGKWVMWRLPNRDLTERLIDIISCKRKPDR